MILCGSSCVLVFSDIRIVFRLYSHPMHTLFLASNFALCSSILRLCQIAYIRSFSLIDSLIFHRMLSASCPPPSFSRSRKDFSTSVVVRIASFGIVLSDSYSMMIALHSLLALGHLLGLQLSCSVFLLPLLSTLLAHVRSMHLAFRLHAVF